MKSSIIKKLLNRLKIYWQYFKKQLYKHLLSCPGGGIGRRACFRCMLPQAVEVRVFFRAPIKKLSLRGEFFYWYPKARTSGRKFDHKLKTDESMSFVFRRWAQGRARHFCRGQSSSQNAVLLANKKTLSLRGEFFIGIYMKLSSWAPKWAPEEQKQPQNVVFGRRAKTT